jgi:hypothetical protein
MFWKISFTFFAFLAFTDAVIAIHTWDHFGDMHAAWAGDAVIAGLAFLAVGWNR